jgi:nitrogen regulatory protein PII
MRQFFSDAHYECVFFEPCRTIRKVEMPRTFGLPGTRTDISDSSGDRYYIRVHNSEVEELVQHLKTLVHIDTPGHGSLIVEHLESVQTGLEGKQTAELVELTAIVSLPNAGEMLGKTALDYGVGVPVISIGRGTGIRDRIGLLRITIPAQKELVHLIVSKHDLDSIFSILIEHGGMNKPGGGFLYSTPVHSAVVDSRMIVGKQRSPASLEQIVSALDELKGTTRWRKRALDESDFHASYRKDQLEIVLFCREGESERYIQRMISSGAGGATVSNIQYLGSSEIMRETSAWERIVVLVPTNKAQKIIESISDSDSEIPEKGMPIVETQRVLRSYSYTHPTRKA